MGGAGVGPNVSWKLLCLFKAGVCVIAVCACVRSCLCVCARARVRACACGGLRGGAGVGQNVAGRGILDRIKEEKERDGEDSAVLRCLCRPPAHTRAYTHERAHEDHGRVLGRAAVPDVSRTHTIVSQHAPIQEL